MIPIEKFNLSFMITSGVGGVGMGSGTVLVGEGDIVGDLLSDVGYTENKSTSPDPEPMASGEINFILDMGVGRGCGVIDTAIKVSSSEKSPTVAGISISS